jgi:nitroreductase
MNALEAIAERRTVKDFTGEPVTREQLQTLLDLAVLAPNHKLTQPWRFYVVPHERIDAFTAAVVGSIRDNDHPKLLAKRDALAKRLPKLGAFLTVGRFPVPDDPRGDQEDYAAVCCAVQNIGVAAHAMGLGSFWSTGDVFERPGVRSFLGLPERLERVASIWLGVPADRPKTARRPASELTTWLD